MRRFARKKRGRIADRWKGEITGCTAVFTENGKVQTVNHVRLDENGQWVPSLKVVLCKVK